jgi:hypothetical protein
MLISPGLFTPSHVLRPQIICQPKYDEEITGEL